MKNTFKISFTLFLLPILFKGAIADSSKNSSCAYSCQVTSLDGTKIYLQEGDFQPMSLRQGTKTTTTNIYNCYSGKRSFDGNIVEFQFMYSAGSVLQSYISVNRRTLISREPDDQAEYSLSLENYKLNCVPTK